MGGWEQHQVVGWQRQDEMRERLDMLRLEIGQDVLTLPTIQTIDHAVELEPKAKKIYAAMESDFIADVESGIITASNALAKLLRLQQIAAGHVLPEGETKYVEVSTAKRQALTDLLEDAGEPAVVFCRFRSDLDTVAAVADGLKLSYGEVSGRRNDYRGWDGDVLGVQIQAGSLGLNLTRARIGVFYTMGYSLGDYQQALARLHRPGQERPVVFYRFLARGTVDWRIVRALDKRAGVIEALLSDYVGGDE